MVIAACGCEGDSGGAALAELGAVELRDRIAAGEISAERVTRVFLERIAALDSAGPELRAIIEVNPDALAIARALDRTLAATGPVGPLHGVPVVIKASIDTADRMATSAGSLALADHHAAVDAEVVRRVRAAGAVIIGKANMSEWANFRSFRSISGWSSLGGQTRNPYVLDRNPCGSSSGSAVAVAARLAPLAIGTETDGSIVCPAGTNGVVGIKPAVGSVSQAGIVPIAAAQDVAGPLARTVADAALLLEAMLEPGFALDTAPAGTGAAPLAGLRIGVARDYLGAGTHAGVEAAFGAALAELREAGAELVDPLEVGADAALRRAELDVLLYEFKAGLDRYLAAVSAGPRSLDELIRYNEAHAAEVMPYFGQDVLLAAAAKGPLEEADYGRAVAASRDRMRATLDKLFDEHGLTALVAPSNRPAWRTNVETGDPAAWISSSVWAAVSGYPSISVPVALHDELPLGLSIIGRPGAMSALLAIAAELERRRGPLPAPRFLPSLPGS